MNRQCCYTMKTGRTCTFEAQPGQRFCNRHRALTEFKARRFKCRKHATPDSRCITCLIVARENQALEQREKTSRECVAAHLGHLKGCNCHTCRQGLRTTFLESARTIREMTPEEEREADRVEMARRHQEDGE